MSNPADRRQLAEAVQALVKTNQPTIDHYEAICAALEALPHRTMVRCHRATEKRLLKVYGSTAYAAEGVRIVAI